MFAQWDNKYSVKIKEIDEQHQKLFGLLNQLHQSIAQGKAKSMIQPVLTELEDYTRTHFKNEEDYMEKFKYPKLKAHTEAHHFFIEKLNEFNKQFNDLREVSTIPIEIWIFLKEWLVEHIMGMDQDYAPYFIAQGIK